MTEAIVCLGLRKAFGAVRAVDGVDLAVDRGRVVTLLGPSGCGKTTLLRLIAGFERPEGGTIAISGRPVNGAGLYVPPEKRRVGMVFQDYALFPNRDVAGNVSYGLPRGAHQRVRVREALELVGLAGMESRFPHELSGGEQQRVALARALAPKPDIVLMDEPFSNLDARLRSRVRGEVRDILRSAGTTAIFVTHDQEEALSMSDTVGVMWDGRLVQVGAPEELYRTPATREVADFVGDADFIPGSASGSLVDTPLGPLPLGVAVEGAVDVLVRPEDVRLSDEGVRGEVLGRDFYGHDQVLTVRLASGETVHARLGPGDGLPIGSAVGVRLELAGAAVVFPAPQPSPARR